MILAGKDQVHRAAIRTHPRGGQIARFTRADVPRIGMKSGRPWPPRFRRVVDGESTRITRVLTMADLAPQVTPQARVITDPRPITRSRIREHRAAPRDVRTPLRRSVGLELREKLV